jgi:hypothetical protein
MSPSVSITASPDGVSRAPTASMLALLRVEDLALAVAAVLAFRSAGGGWGLFAALCLLPDLAMLGYIAGPATGARCYNVAHTYLVPILLAALGWATGHGLGLQIGLIWCAHIGVDRALGFGLKYPTSFADTHLGRIGRRD